MLNLQKPQRPDLSVPRISHGKLTNAVEQILASFSNVWMTPPHIGQHLPLDFIVSLNARGGLGGVGGAFGLGADMSMTQRIQKSMHTLMRVEPHLYEEGATQGAIYIVRGISVDCSQYREMPQYRRKS